MKGIRLHGFVKESSVNGPGNRSVLWTQGCLHECPGCFNHDSWELRAGEVYSEEQVLKMIPFEQVDGITISGGEPFLQAKALSSLAAKIKARGKDILVYTGYCLEELYDKDEENFMAFLHYIDILIDGPYQSDVPPVHPWAGSGNQRIFKLKDGKVIGEIFAVDGPVPLNREIHILKDGSVLTTGFQ